MSRGMVAMSGGVDSGVAALLLTRRGCSCVGVTMKLFGNEDVGLSREHSCCSLDDVDDARRVAYSLGMEHYVFNFSDRFRETVIRRFVEAYETGRTPNPCIDCNRFLKFDALFHRAEEMECDFVATGHYARTEYDAASGRWLLKKALDDRKDQSYVLYSLTQAQLARIRFPLGELTKTQVRALAEEAGLINAKKHDSQDICFVQNGTYADFIRQTTGKEYPPGNFVTPDGQVLGRHRGIIYYTVGQRKGLGLALPAPLYVQAVNPADNTVTLTPEQGLYSSALLAKDINLIALPRLDAPLRCTARVRYRQKEQPATVTQLDDDTLRVEFDAPQRAVTAGQAVVLYRDDTVLGGGTIQ